MVSAADEMYFIISKQNCVIEIAIGGAQRFLENFLDF